MSTFHRTPMRKALGRALYRLALMLALAACAGHDDEPPSPPPPSVGSATVGAAGGTVSGPDGVTLSVAADPDLADTTFRIARDSTGAPALAGMTLLSPVYAVTPHGTSFATSAVLKLPYDASKAPAGATVVVLRGETDGTWHVSPVRSTVAGAALVDVSGLSWYAIGVCTPGDAGVFGFGIGDCPANHELKLEYLDDSGFAHEVPRDALGYAAPFLPDITTATDVRLRLSWRRPPGLDRVDGVFLSGVGSGYIVNQEVNQASWSQTLNVRLDPQNTIGASGPFGIVKRLKARAEYCWVGFIIGRGDNQKVCWEFDADLAFRLRDGEPAPDKPTITVQPLPVSVYEGHDAGFHVDAQSGGSLFVSWERKDPSGNWAPAQSFPRGGTTSNGGRDLTLKAVESHGDNGALFRARLTGIGASGKQSPTVTSDEVQLTISNGGSQAMQWTVQPTLQPANAGETVSLAMTANAVPYATVEVHRVSPAGLDEVVKVCAPAPVAITNPSAALPQNPTTCNWTQGPVAVADDGTKFYGLARSDVDPAHPLESDRVTLSVKSAAVAPAIGTQPAAVSVKVGETAVFSVAASGTGPLSYQWRFKAAAAASAVALGDHASGAGSSGVAGSASSTLTISNAQTADAGSYSVVVSNGTAPDATSQDAVLTVAAPPPPANPGVTLAAGGNNTCLVLPNGTLACWGDNAFGQLGNSSGLAAPRPVTLLALSGVVGIDSAGSSACAYKSDGRVVCWGSNYVGQLGDGSTIDRPTPELVKGLDGAVGLAAGTRHHCAVRADGTAWCWGFSPYAPRDAQGNSYRTNATAVVGLSDVTQLAAGYDHTCALRSTGLVACWGAGFNAQLGDPAAPGGETPFAVPGLSGVVKLAASVHHSCAAKSDGTVWCWGTNDYGQLGNGASSASSGPVRVSGLTDAIGLAAGTYHACALRSGGSVVCWGYNGQGQLGDGSTTNRSAPVGVTGLSGVVALAAGELHTCALKSDGSVLCWGRNNAGQLGDGGFADRATPVVVAF